MEAPPLASFFKPNITIPLAIKKLISILNVAAVWNNSYLIKIAKNSPFVININ